MKLRINAGFGNGTKGFCEVDTDKLPKEFQLCHGALAIRVEAVPEELPPQPAPEQVVRSEKKGRVRF